jgi:hypothetical protein
MAYFLLWAFRERPDVDLERAVALGCLAQPGAFGGAPGLGFLVGNSSGLFVRRGLQSPSGRDLHSGIAEMAGEFDWLVERTALGLMLRRVIQRGKSKGAVGSELRAFLF